MTTDVSPELRAAFDQLPAKDAYEFLDLFQRLNKIDAGKMHRLFRAAMNLAIRSVEYGESWTPDDDTTIRDLRQRMPMHVSITCDPWWHALAEYRLAADDITGTPDDAHNAPQSTQAAADRTGEREGGVGE